MVNATCSPSLEGIDLAENVFERAVADRDWRLVERARPTRIDAELP